jgi:hypothetical protein
MEDLSLSANEGKVDGINAGLMIRGKGTSKFNIADDNGKIHTNQIPNSLNLPELKSCLLSPQNWVQEEGDSKTWMDNFAHCCTLHWGGRYQKMVPFNPSTNTSTFFKAPSSLAYQVFTTMYKAIEAPYFQRETVLWIPGLRPLREAAEVIPKEFIAGKIFIYN